MLEATQGPAGETSTADDPWRDPPLECDVVMKGGISSGVVYPAAVVRLAKRYRFRSVGGTSAGAIAAAALAAAEHGRASGGYAELAKVSGELGGSSNGEPFILQLFQPEEGARGLFDTALGFQRGGPVKGVRTAISAFPFFPILAGVLAGLAIVVSLTGSISGAVAVLIVALTPWILIGGVARDLHRAFLTLAATDFGMCRLGPRSDGKLTLTVWLHELIQRAAGRPAGAAPLTFADLWGVPGLSGDESPGALDARRQRLELLGWNAAERDVDLQVVTTDLTTGRPIRLPMLRDRWRDDYSDGGLLFDPAEWRAFFPRNVVDHMEAAATPLTAGQQAVIDQRRPGRPLCNFPGGAQLPVVVAARMSLSFPVLISAIPLWRIDYEQGKTAHLRRMIFSDGGISSNFPVHLFDAPLPTRPTFAFDLTSFASDEQADLDDPRQCVRDPAAVNASAVESARSLETMLDFLVAIKDAMQNWRDNAQARMPGFRERVVHIKLAKGEGGLNLAMDREKVTRLTDRGEHAAGVLINLFSGPEGFDPEPTEHWNDHRFARFRVVMGATERFLVRMRTGFESPADPATTPYATRIAEGVDQKPYPLTAERLAEAQVRLLDYAKSQPATDATTLDDHAVPHPKAEVRLSPPV